MEVEKEEGRWVGGGVEIDETLWDPITSAPLEQFQHPCPHFSLLPVFLSHLYRCHGCVILPGSETLKDTEAVEANDGRHHQVAVQQINQRPKTLCCL